MRLVTLGAAAIAVLLALAMGAGSAPAAQAGQRASGGPQGIVPPQINGQSISHVGHAANPARAINTTTAGPTKADNLTYGNADQLDPNTNQGGPVTHTITDYAIYWVPSGYSQPSTYQPTVNRYFRDVAADSGKTTNVYSAGTQYSDLTGQVQYNSTWGGWAVDANSFPASGCTVNSYPDPNEFQAIGLTECLDDTQIQAEVQSFASSEGWPHGPNVEFFVFTPKNVGSCIADPTNLSFGQDCSYSEYCAYHSSFFTGPTTDTSTEYLYANMPYPNQDQTDSDQEYGSDCWSGEFPNAADPTNLDEAAADEVINVTSHENNETITDPLGTGWWVDNANSAFNGYEDGDLCAWYFPTRAVLGGHASQFGGTEWNQVINGDHYFVQGEWSNKSATTTANSGCVWNYKHGPIYTGTPPSLSGTATVGDTLTAGPGSWDGSQTSYKYTFLRCLDSTCQTAYSLTTAGTSVGYTLKAADDKHTMEVQVVASNSAGTSPAVTSDPTSAVNGEPEGGVPTLSGTATVGQTLTGDVDAGGWGFAPTRYASALLRCNSGGTACVTIKTFAGTASTPISYKLLPADDRHTLELQVIASNAAGSSNPQASTLTSVVNGEPEGGTATILGTTTHGQTLTAGTGSWSPAATSYRYQWERCNSAGTSCVVFKTVSSTHASSTYALTTGDETHTLRVIVTATNAAGASDPVTSSATGIVT